MLVVGSGIAGLTAALTASQGGLSVLVVEKAKVYGGTSAYSEGMVWAPLSRQAQAAGISDSVDAAIQYLSETAPGYVDEARTRSYVENAPRALAFVEDLTCVCYELTSGSMDYQPDAAGATKGKRALTPRPVHGGELGDLINVLRLPLAPTMIFGTMSVAAEDLPVYYALQRSPSAWLRAARLFAGYAFDRLRGYPRGLRLTGGNGVVAGLLMALREHNVGLFNNTEPAELKRANGRVNGVTLHKPDGSEHQVEVRRGVVLACGGFASSKPAQQHYYEHVKRGMRHASLGAESNQGDGHRIAREIGAKLSTNAAEPAAWAPVSLLRLEDGSTVACPHLMERGKPGIIVVDESGNRFCNEAICYHRFVKALIEPERVGSGKAWILCDHRALRAYGVGGVPPFPARISPYLKRGYLVHAACLKELADKLDIDARGLLTTVQRFNQMAGDGEDLDFGRGADPYTRAAGDPSWSPNPSLGPIERPPFYAVEVLPGDLGSFYGLATDPLGRVLDEEGQVIPGLFAAGNEALTISGGDYSAAGLGVGPAMTFGYLAGRTLAGDNA